VWDCLPQWTWSGYPDSSLFGDALYHFLVAYAFSTLWTQLNEPYEWLARCIGNTSPECLVRCTECTLHHWDNRNTDHDRCSLWSWQICRNTKRCGSVAPLLTIHTTRPRHQGSRFLVLCFLTFVWNGHVLEAYHRRNVVLLHLHSASNTSTTSVGN